MNAEVSLPTSLQKKGYSLKWLDDTGSTNIDALEAGRAGHAAPCWFVARRQSSGKGRSGRQWASPEGNLYASLLLRNPCRMAVAAQLGFVAGIAVHDAIASRTGLSTPRLALKWPNDVLLDGRKLVGMLLEAQTSGNEVCIVVGCGINLVSTDVPERSSVASLAELPGGISLQDMFTALSSAFDDIYSFWHKSEGRLPAERFAPIRKLWLERAAGLGSPASVKLPTGPVSGTFAGIDATGRLELQTENGIQLVDAGDLFFPGMMS